MRTSTRHVTLDDGDPVPVTLTARGDGRPVLVLHGGAGPFSVENIAGPLAASGGVRTFVPVHPGFDGTPRPEGLDGIRVLARLYTRLLGDLGLTDVAVVGSSIGGWIAAEMALLPGGRIGRVVLVGAAGLAVDAHPIVDFFSLTMDQVVDLSYHDPGAFRVDPATVSERQRTVMAGNRAALQVYGGATMADPSLLGRLPGIAVPTLVVWGAADRIVPPEHGQAYAAAIPGARLEVISEAGHLPQLERRERLLDLIRPFVAASSLSGRA